MLVNLTKPLSYQNFKAKQHVEDHVDNLVDADKKDLPETKSTFASPETNNGDVFCQPSVLKLHMGVLISKRPLTCFYSGCKKQ